VLDTICENNAFAKKYILEKEIGRGGFSVVHQCKDRQTLKEYAVKIIDLRPLRLRERFNPARLRREVDIMKKLKHPNIVEFIEGFETEEQLQLVMEFCPGDELFDVILARQRYSEQDAKPVFAQVARALYYLHCLNIIHRDIKPENILILHRTDANGNPVAKLLDFGLSKNAGAGSAAKTFVGTPCYLSPEVEYTAKGLGGTYGLPADCWSLGAVLYVMLVARFPEFEHDAVTDKIVLRLPTILWDGISLEAKHLVRALMNANPNARLTARDALLHPWLSEYRSTPAELEAVAVACYDLGQNLQEEAEAEAQRMEQEGYGEEEVVEELTAGGITVHRQAMVLRRNPNPYTAHHDNGASAVSVCDQLQVQLAPLLRLQRSIATCFAEAHAGYQDFPEVATQVRRGAMLCRQQFSESTKMLAKVEQTAQSVLELFPDLILAVEEGEPKLAGEFFNMVREWVVELRDMVAKTQQVNQASMAQIQTIVERSTLRLNDRAAARRERDRKVSPRSVTVPKKLLDAVKQLYPAAAAAASGAASGAGAPFVAAVESGTAAGVGASDQVETLSTEQVLELFMGLFGQSGALSASGSTNSLRSDEGTSSRASLHEDSSFSGADDSVDVEDVEGPSFDSFSVDDDGGAAMSMDTSESSTGGTAPASGSGGLGSRPPMPDLIIPEVDPSAGVVATTTASSPIAASRLAEALHKLRQVDMILEQLSVFWANTEVVLDMLTKKGQHVEQLIGFSQKPRLMARFRERMDEYTRFWEGVSTLCKNYVSGVQTATTFDFLEPHPHQDVHLGGVSLPVTGQRVDKLDSL